MNEKVFEPMSPRFYRLRDISKIIGLKRTSVYNLIAAGHLPQPIKVGRASLWKSEDVALLVDKIASGGLGKPAN